MNGRYEEYQRQQKENMMKIATRVGTSVVAVAALGLFFGSWFRVDEGERAVILTNGSYTEVAGPGLNFKLPFIQAARFITIRNEVITLEKLAAYSFDQQTAEMRISINYQIKAEDVARIYTQYTSVDGAVTRVLVPRVFDIAKTVFGQFTAQRAIQERGKLNADITMALQEALKGTGVEVTSVQVENIDYSDAYEATLEKAASAKADIERARSELARVEQEAQQKVKQAEAEATAKKLQADADAYATSAAGKATAEAIRERGAALRDNPTLVSLVAAEKWNGILPTSMVPGSAVPFVNIK